MDCVKGVVDHHRKKRSMQVRGTRRRKTVQPWPKLKNAPATGASHPSTSRNLAAKLPKMASSRPAFMPKCWHSHLLLVCPHYHRSELPAHVWWTISSIAASLSSELVWQRRERNIPIATQCASPGHSSRHVSSPLCLIMEVNNKAPVHLCIVQDFKTLYI